MTFESLLEGWDGEEIAIRRDPRSDAWMFIGVHSTVLGPAMGGTRLKSYPTPADALEDVLRLSEAMTWKQAAADTPYGGGKAVIAVPEIPGPARRSGATCCCGTRTSWSPSTGRTSRRPT